MSLPWLLLASVAVIGQIIPFIYERSPYRWIAWGIGGLAAFHFIRRLVAPREVVTIDSDHIDMIGVRPGWWKLFQRWRRASIPVRDIVDVRVGKVRNRYGLAPLGEPSRNVYLQNFLWIRYRRGEEQMQIYYPHLNNIAQWPALVSALREAVGEKLIEFPTGGWG
jgi:hypothetical protein